MTLAPSCYPDCSFVRPCGAEDPANLCLASWPTEPSHDKYVLFQVLSLWKSVVAAIEK